MLQLRLDKQKQKAGQETGELHGPLQLPAAQCKLILNNDAGTSFESLYVVMF
jgi:hypothetical protein